MSSKCKCKCQLFPNTFSKEEVWREKQRQRSSRLFGARINYIPCRACSRFGKIGLIHHILLNLPRQNIKRGKELNKFCPPSQTDATTFAFASVSILLLWRSLSLVDVADYAGPGLPLQHHPHRPQRCRRPFTQQPGRWGQRPPRGACADVVLCAHVATQKSPRCDRWQRHHRRRAGKNGDSWAPAYHMSAATMLRLQPFLWDLCVDQSNSKCN